ncbi:MAG: N-acetyltransferase [Limosilactobacillus sp.]|uniref:GNAT family N-acetyltransferase n=1 Tax=Limosilactobacillus sp. TaxID=2773925 RepID=UPI002707F1C1|nr:N-acetyltransferase [Limosilactobacillus sp.]
MKLRKATMEDFDQIMDILRDGRNQLAEQGIDQWQGDYPNADVVKEDIENGWGVLAQSDDEQTVGYVAVVDGPDTSYDTMKGKWLVETENYVVLHRVAVHSKHTGHGYASKLFIAVIDYIHDHRKDVETMRIDTHEDNKIMQHLITKHGFEKVGEVYGYYSEDETIYVYAKLTATGEEKVNG